MCSFFQDKLRMFMDKDGGSLEPKLVLTNSERKTVDQMSQDLEENRELAINRLVELEKTNAVFKVRKNYVQDQSSLIFYSFKVSKLQASKIVELNSPKKFLKNRQKVSMHVGNKTERVIGLQVR